MSASPPGPEPRTLDFTCRQVGTVGERELTTEIKERLFSEHICVHYRVTMEVHNEIP